MKVGFLSGTSIVRSALFDAWARRMVATPFGTIEVREQDGVILLNRHGPAGLPPHAINHRANLQALADLGCRDVVAVCSVGSLQPELAPGTVLVCSDYVSFRPATLTDVDFRALAPGVANNLVPRIVGALPYPVPTDKVYVQTPGPRFETKAEIRILRGWGDVVGMTAAAEADLCGELGLNYNLLCIVDNFANGAGGPPLSPESFRELVKANQERVDDLFRRLLTLFA